MRFTLIAFLQPCVPFGPDHHSRFGLIKYQTKNYIHVDGNTPAEANCVSCGCVSTFDNDNIRLFSRSFYFIVGIDAWEGSACIKAIAGLLESLSCGKEETIKSPIYLLSFIFLIRFVHPNDCSCLIDSFDSLACESLPMTLFSSTAAYCYATQDERTTKMSGTQWNCVYNSLLSFDWEPFNGKSN